MTSKNTIRALIWDYDGTLVDSRQKNLNVTRRIMKSIAGTDPMTFPALQTIDEYVLANTRALNWRDFYSREFNMNEEQIDAVGRAWTEFQLQDRTPTPLFRGIQDVFQTLRSFRHGVVSQNSRSTISQVLQNSGLFHHFHAIIGYEEVDLRRQKPVPDGILLCIEELMDSREGIVLCVGDHETDTQCCRNAAAVLREAGSRVELRSIALLHSPDSSTSGWSVKPDHEVRVPEDIARIALGT